MTILALVMLLAATAQAADATYQAPTAEQELYLRVSTHSGELPLEVDLRGELRGFDLTTIQSCKIRVDRTYLTPSRMTLVERAEHPCLAGAVPENPILPTFKRTLVLQEPGDYLLRIMLQPKEGRPIAGMTHPVKVYKAPLQIGVIGTTTD